VPSPFSASAVRVAAATIPLIGRAAVSKAQQRRIEERASSVVVADNADRFIEHLDDLQLVRLRELIDSPEFATLMLQAMVMAAAGMKEDGASSLREQVRSSLRQFAIFTAADLLQATDVVTELLTSAAHAVRLNAGSPLNNEYAVALAARVAATAARNSELVTAVRDRANTIATAGRLRSQVKSKHSKLQLPNVVANRRVAWDRLYVPPKLLDRETAAAQPEGSSGEKLSTLLTQNLRLVVLGDPGAGKSTLAEKLAYDLASDKLDTFDQVVPIVLVVRKFTEHSVAQEGDLVDYLLAACKRTYATEMPRAQLNYLLLTGRAFVIVDGIDELGESAKRSDFVELVESFATAYPLTRIVVTSREVGYDEAALDEEYFPVVLIRPFGDEQVERYVRNWFRLERRDELTTPFLDESQRVSDIRTSPLILSLLCTLYQAEQAIPENRPEIYSRCADLLIEKWDSSRGIDLKPELRPFIRRVVHRLAWRIFTDERARQALPRSELVAFLAGEVLHDRYDSRDEAVLASEDFLNFCADRAWVLTDTGSGIREPWYGFTHKTFMEYFAANHLVKQEPSVEGVWSAIRPMVSEGSWHEVSELAVQILDRDRDDGADQLLTLVLADTSSGNGPNRSDRLIFAAACLSSCAPSTPTLRRVVDQVVDLAMAGGRDHFAEPQRLSDIDTPLFMLFKVLLPGNTKRLAYSLIERLDEGLAVPIHRRTAALIYTIAEMYRSFPVGQKLADHALTLKDEEHDRWIRLRDGWPCKEDVRLLGLNALFGQPQIGAHRFNRPVLKIFRQALGISRPPVEDVDSRLSDLYHPIAALNIPAQQVRSEHSIDPTPWSRLDWTQLREYSPPARASLLLLLTGWLGQSRERSYLHIDDSQVRTFFAAHSDRQLDVDAIKTLNMWGLPEEAHGQLVNWLIGGNPYS
jgi:hypothetical protein